MSRWIANLLGLSIVGVLAVATWGGFGVSRHIIVAVDKWGNSAPDLKPTLTTLNRPCGIRNVKSNANYSTFYSEGSLMPCGTLAEVATSVVKAGDAVVQTQLVERTTAPHVTAAMDTLNDSAQKLGGTADNLSGTATALTGTANAATGTLTAATTTIQTAGTTIAAFQPVLGHLNASSADLDAFLKGRMLTETLPDIAANLKITTGNVAEMTTDSATWYHKWLHPDKKKLTFVGGVDATTLWIHSHILPPLF
jgi:hypothetical protein